MDLPRTWPVGYLTLLTLIALLSWIYLFKLRRNRWIKGIPIKNDHWLVGLDGFDDGNVIQEVVKKYGPLVQFSLYFHSILVIADKKLAKIALKEINGKGFFHNPTPKWVADSIFSFDTGPEWQKRRTAFRKAFSNTSLRYHAASIMKLNEKLCGVMTASAEKGEILKMDELFVQLTVGVICELAFELDVKVFESSTNTLRIDHSIQETFKYGWVRRIPFATYLKNLPIYPFKDYKLARDNFEGKMGEIYDYMKKLRDEGKLREDSLALALVNFGELPGIDRRLIVSEICTFFVAGRMDTTAHTLSFMIYALARYPEIQARCQVEVDQWMANHTAKDSLGSLPPYVEAVLKESMRRWPTAATGSFREVKQPEGIQLTPEIHIPNGWWILVSIYAIHNSEDAWGKDVNEFRPERWLQQDGTATDLEDDPLSASDQNGDGKASTTMPTAPNNSHLASASCYAGAGYTSEELCFLPFSYGLRNCIGMNLAMMELRITILNLISKFHFSLGNEEMRDENQIFETAFTMRPRNGCPIRVTKRDIQN